MLRNGLLTLLVVTLTIVAMSIVQSLQFLQTLAQDNPSCRTFRETGKTVCGQFLNFWSRNGGLQVFGYPISGPLLEKSALNGKDYTVQYFQRSEFELHPENNPPYDVLLSQLGMLRFKSEYSGVDPGEPNEDNLPLYPDAQNVKVERISLAVPDGDVINTTTFQTTASPKAVMTFYDDILYNKNGWAAQEVRGSDYIEYVYVPANDGPVYGLSIETKATRTGTYVTLRLSKTLPK